MYSMKIIILMHKFWKCKAVTIYKIKLTILAVAQEKNTGKIFKKNPVKP